MTVFYEVAELNDPSPTPFAVVAIYPDKKKGDGVLGIVRSLHADRREANRRAAALTRAPHP